jgi:peptide subunit release factor 1 (eRF1)
MATSLRSQEREALRRNFEELSSNGPLSILNRKEFSALAALDCDSGPVVSLYIDLSPQNRHNNAWLIELKSLVRDVLAGREGTADEAVVRGEIDRMETWIRDRAPGLGRGAVLFSCPSRGLWKPVRLPIPLPSRLRVGRRPYLRPLARVWDENARCAVVVLDKQRARLFVSQLGAVQEVADLFEDTPGHHKQGGWSQMRFQRQHEAHVLWHAGAVAEATELLLERFAARHLLVAGPSEVRHEFRSSLSPRAVERWAGEFTVDLDAGVTEVEAAITPLRRETEAGEEIGAIGIVNDAVSGGRGVWGLVPTLAAVREKRVRLLVVHDRYRAPGSECRRCRLLLAEPQPACPACGGQLEPVEDLVDAILESTVIQEGELELVRSNEARKLLPPGEPIGAHLRF